MCFPDFPTHSPVLLHCFLLLRIQALFHGILKSSDLIFVKSKLTPSSVIVFEVEVCISDLGVDCRPYLWVIRSKFKGPFEQIYCVCPFSLLAQLFALKIVVFRPNKKSPHRDHCGLQIIVIRQVLSKSVEFEQKILVKSQVQKLSFSNFSSRFSEWKFCTF